MCVCVCVQTTPPSKMTRDVLVQRFKECGDAAACRRAGDVSDTILFDFLVDDHDRHRDHNWVSSDERSGCGGRADCQVGDGRCS